MNSLKYIILLLNLMNLITNANKAITPIQQEQIGKIEIPSLKIYNNLYSKESSHNKVEENVTILKESTMPDEKNSNLILAAHSGNGDIAFFNDLINIKKEDPVYIYYKEKKYTYYLVKSYTQPKNGTIHIYRNYTKDTLTLITCKLNNDEEQIVFIFER